MTQAIEHLTIVNGVITAGNVTHIPVFLPDPDCGEDVMPIPGPVGPTGGTGGTGATGGQGVPGVTFLEEGPQGEDGFPIPGPVGPAGAPGVGIQGLPGVALMLEGEPGEDGWPIPGPVGLTGATGGVGGTGPQGIQGLPGVTVVSAGDSWDDCPPAVLASAFGVVRTAVGSEISASSPTDTLTLLSSALTILVAGTPATKTFSFDLADNLVILRDQKTQNTNGGTFTSGALRTRDLNQEVTDNGNNCTLSANQFTLTAGTYEILAFAPALIVDRHQAFLRNTTSGSTLLTGSTQITSSAAAAMTYSIIFGRFTVAASQALEIQHQCETTGTTIGFGAASNFSTEVYTFVLLRRVG